jgi:hypothetical protein
LQDVVRSRAAAANGDIHSDTFHFIGHGLFGSVDNLAQRHWDRKALKLFFVGAGGADLAIAPFSGGGSRLS